MFNISRHLPALLLVGGVFVAAPACASFDYGYRNQGSSRDYERRAYQNGFNEGVRQGERDARDRRDASYARDRAYRDADGGYDRDYGRRDDYRRMFRQGYEQGYTEGYNRVARSHGPVYAPTVPVYPAPTPQGGVYRSRAAEIGYRDGYEAGRSDARDRDRFDPRRAKRYREGDHNYNDRYGSRDAYKREYRSAFEQGYDAGYRENRR